MAFVCKDYWIIQVKISIS